MIAILKSDLLRKFTAGFLVGIAIVFGTQPAFLSGVAHVLGT